MSRKTSRIFGVAHLKGGTGKTSTAIQMAVMLLESGRNVLFVDADVKGANGSRFLRRREESRGEDQQQLHFTQCRSKKHLLEIVKRCEEEGTDIVIDTNPTVSELFVAVLILAHVAIHPVRQGHTELDSIPNLINLLEMVKPIRKRNGLPKLKSRVLTTDYSPTKQGRLIAESLQQLEDFAYLGEIPHSEKFGEALVKGKALWEITKHHRHTVQIREVILGCIEK